MKKHKYMLLLIFTSAYLLIGTFTFSQSSNRQIDSLLSLLKKDKEDTNKVNHLNNLSHEYINKSSYDTALQYANVSLQAARQLNFQKGIATSYSNIGHIYYLQGDYSKT